MAISFESGRFIDAHTQAAKLSPKIIGFNLDYLDDATIGLYPTDVVLISAATGAGKCLAPDTLVLKFDGDVVRAGDVITGDVLMGPGSSPRNVLSTAVGISPMFKIVPVKGDSFTCNDVHVLTLCHTVTGEIVDVPLNEYLEWGKTAKHVFKLFHVPADFPDHEDDLPVDPWLLGFWYADGSKDVDRHGRIRSVAITKPENEAVAKMRVIAAKHGCTANDSSTDSRCATWRLVTPRGQPNPLLDSFRKLETKGPIPHRIMTGSKDDREAFLAGWIDGDGYSDKGMTEIVFKREDWANGIAFIARSLGFRALVSEKLVKLDGWDESRSYSRVTITGDTTHLPISTKHKRCERTGNRDPLRTGFSVVPIGAGAYAGFELDGDGRFLLGDFTVTHNTHIASLLSERWAKEGKRVAFFALEARRREIEQRMLYREMYSFKAKLPGPFSHYMQTAHADEWTPHAEAAGRRIEESWGCRMGTSYSGGSFGADDIVREFAQLRGKADVIVLDHLHFLTLGDNENKDMKKALETISSMANDLEIPIVCVAHLRKSGRSKALVPSIEEIHGSSDIAKIATVAVMMAPAPDVASFSYIAPTFMQVVKLRVGGATPYAALVEFNFATDNYEPGYRLIRLGGSREEFQFVDGGKDNPKPYWARRAK